jgi:glycosyltransferase involved in cell wall biosynthesis
MVCAQIRVANLRRNAMNATPSFAGWITACIPYYRCRRYLRRAAESLLAQTYPWIRILVVNDGDPDQPWSEISHITDRRLLRFSLPSSRGPYFCLEVARRATPDPYFMMQDADDWAAPERAATLLTSLLTEDSDLAVSAQPQFYEAEDGTPRLLSVRWDRVARDQDDAEFVVRKRLTEHFRYRVPQAGLIRTALLEDIGGYHGGFRVAWDVMLTNLVLMTGSVSWTPAPLYYRLLRAESLTQSGHTGVESTYRSEVCKCLRRLYRECYGQYRLFRSAAVNRAELCDRLRSICARYITPEERIALDVQSSKLRAQMA